MRLLLALAAGALLLLCAAAPAAAPPRCFGAASRDAERPCTNPKLRLTVTPRPDRALLTPNLACGGGSEQTEGGCDYGVEATEASATVAMVGDSHAAHWRGTLEVVARARDWHVAEFALPHCSFSAAVPDAGPETADACPPFRQRIIDWLTDHPEVTTVFTSANALEPIEVPPGRRRFSTRVAGFEDQWAKLPATVERIVVLRDVPMDAVGTFDCVRRAIRRERPAGTACRVRRNLAVRRDAQVVAAQRVGGRTSVIDLTPQFCGERWCFPVVGGVLVHKDQDHLGQLFARTLGPIANRYLSRGKGLPG